MMLGLGGCYATINVVVIKDPRPDAALCSTPLVVAVRPPSLYVLHEIQPYSEQRAHV